MNVMSEKESKIFIGTMLEPRKNSPRAAKIADRIGAIKGVMCCTSMLHDVECEYSSGDHPYASPR